MQIKIIPIFKYPYDKTQNQILDDGKLFNQDYQDLSNLDINRTFNEINVDDDVIINESPNIKGNTPLGQHAFDINLSMNSFSIRFFRFDIFDIKMLVFFRMDDNGSVYERYKYFYYVDNIERINANNYRFSLAIDVFKTYYYEVMEIDGLNPSRYFIESNILIDNIKSYNDDMHIIGSYPITSELNPQYTYRDSNGGYKVNNDVVLWDYHYIRYGGGSIGAGETLTNTSRHTYLTIPIPRLYNDTFDKLRNKIQKYVGYIKTITSPIAPFNNISDIDIIFNKYDERFVDVDITSSDEWLPLFKDTLLVKVNKLEDFDVDFKQFLIDEGFGNEELIILSFDTNHETPLYNKNGGLAKYKPNDYINLTDYDGYINDMSNVNLYPNLEIGFINDEKKIVSKKETSFYMGLEHSLYNAKDYIRIENDENIESIIYRSNELNIPKITEQLEQYLYENKNALIQKEKELGKYATRDTVVRGIVSVVGAGLVVAGAVATGGSSLVVSAGVLAGAGGVYNSIESLSKNARKRAMHEAELSDKSGKIENFTPSNYNENQVKNKYLPIIRTYSRNINDMNYFKYDDYQNAIEWLYDNNPNVFDNNILQKYGVNVIIDMNKKMSELITREHYNYIEVKDITNIKQNGNIPSKLFSHIKEVLLNGITYASIDYIKNDITPINKEV